MDDALKAVLDAAEPFVQAAKTLPADATGDDMLYILIWDIHRLGKTTVADLRRLALAVEDYHANINDYIIINTRHQPRQEAEAGAWRYQRSGKGGG